MPRRAFLLMIALAMLVLALPAAAPALPGRVSVSGTMVVESTDTWRPPTTYVHEWNATARYGVTHGTFTITEYTTADDGTRVLVGSTSWPITGLKRVGRHGVEFLTQASPASESLDAIIDWGGGLYRAYDGGKNGDSLWLSCVLHDMDYHELYPSTVRIR